MQSSRVSKWTVSRSESYYAFLCCVFACLAVAPPALAQPVVTTGGAVNSASYSLVGLPNGSLAQGSMFTVFGTNLGSASNPAALTFPLQTTLQGTSIGVTSGGANCAALMIFTSPTQLSGILPSDCPTGNANLTVTAGGQTSAAVPVTIVRSSLGIFAQNSAGSGPGIVQQFISQTDQPLTAVVRPARPGQTMILWATGLGPVTGNEAQGPLPGDMKDALGVEVWVGLKKALVTYAGRSGCCAAIDQIVFEIPQDITGCYVPVAARAGGVVSNFVTIAISQGGAPCSDANGVSTLDFAAALTQGSVRVGVVDLSSTLLTIAVGSQGLPVRSDIATGLFGRFTVPQLIASRGITQSPSVGSCSVSVFRGLNPIPIDPIQPAPLDAGANLTVSGPKGDKPVATVALGLYSGTLGGAPLDQILTAIGQPGYLDPGPYTIAGSGGSGATGVGAFSGRLNLAAPVTWSNASQLSTIDRSQDLEITWTGGDAQTFAVVSGISVASGSAGPTATTPGAAFLCVERASVGRLVIPSFVMQALPQTPSSGLIPSGFLLVGSSGAPVKFSAANLDAGFLTYRNLAGKNIIFR